MLTRSIPHEVCRRLGRPVCWRASPRRPSWNWCKRSCLKGKAGGLDHLALDAKRDRLFLANKANNTLDVVDLKDGKLLKQMPNQTGIQGVAYAADLDRVFVGLGTNGLCNVFDGDSYKARQDASSSRTTADNVATTPTSIWSTSPTPRRRSASSTPRPTTLKADIKLPAAAEGFDARGQAARGCT